MAVTNVSQSETFDQWRVKTNTIATNLGDSATLTTAATTAVGGVNELKGNVGTLNNLTTTDKSNLVAAVNETKNFSLAISIALG
jgi:hypothetical protein